MSRSLRDFRVWCAHRSHSVTVLRESVALVSSLLLSTGTKLGSTTPTFGRMSWADRVDAQEVLRRLKYLGADVLSADRKKNEVKRFLKHRTKRTEIVRSHNIYPHGVGFLRVHGITAHG